MDSVKPGVAVLIGLVLAAVIQELTAVLHRHEAQAGAGDRGVHRDRAGDHDPVRVLDRPRVDRLVGPPDRRRRSSAAFYLGDTTRASRLYFVSLAGMGMLSTVGRHRVDGHVRPDLGQRAGHRGDVRRVRGPAGRDPRRPRRDRELDEGHHEGRGDRHRGAGGDVAVRLVRRGGDKADASLAINGDSRSASINRTCWSGC